MNKNDVKQEAKELLVDFLEKKQVSKVKLAKKIGVSHSVLTYVTQEQWENVSDEMVLKIVNALKSPNGDYRLVETDNFSTVQTMCKYVARWKQMSGLIGFTGAGKTTALKHYYKANPNVYYIEGKSNINNRQFLRELLDELGVNYEGTLYDMTKRIASEFNKKESPLLIIDEAGKLSHNQILVLHDLRNATQNNLGILLAGCEYFRENLEKGVKKGKIGMPEFYGRIANWQTLFIPTKEEAKAIFEQNGVCFAIFEQEIFESFRDIYSTIVSIQISHQIQLEDLIGDNPSNE